MAEAWTLKTVSKISIFMHAIAIFLFVHLRYFGDVEIDMDASLLSAFN